MCRVCFLFASCEAHAQLLPIGRLRHSAHFAERRLFSHVCVERVKVSEVVSSTRNKTYTLVTTSATAVAHMLSDDVVISVIRHAYYSRSSPAYGLGGVGDPCNSFAHCALRVCVAFLFGEFF